MFDPDRNHAFPKRVEPLEWDGIEIDDAIRMHGWVRTPVVRYDDYLFAV